MSDPSGGHPEPELAPIRKQRERLARAADDLEEAVTGPAGDVDAWKSRVQGALAEVSSALANHVTKTEAPDGLYSDIMERSPRLAHRITRLREDHDDLRRRIAALEPQLAEPPSESQVDQIRDGALDLLLEISKHRHRGADLIYESYDFDIGTGE